MSDHTPSLWDHYGTVDTTGVGAGDGADVRSIMAEAITPAPSTEQVYPDPDVVYEPDEALVSGGVPDTTGPTGAPNPDVPYNPVEPLHAEQWDTITSPAVPPVPLGDQVADETPVLVDVTDEALSAPESVEEAPEVAEPVEEPSEPAAGDVAPDPATVVESAPEPDPAEVEDEGEPAAFGEGLLDDLS